jgi:hypothetical protein
MLPCSQTSRPGSLPYLESRDFYDQIASRSTRASEGRLDLSAGQHVGPAAEASGCDLRHARRVPLSLTPWAPASDTSDRSMGLGHGRS